MKVKGRCQLLVWEYNTVVNHENEKAIFVFSDGYLC